jgi:hypothetical protein
MGADLTAEHEPLILRDTPSPKYRSGTSQRSVNAALEAIDCSRDCFGRVASLVIECVRVHIHRDTRARVSETL